MKQTCIIIGGTKGLGNALAKLFDKEYDIVITGRTPLDDNTFRFEALNIDADVGGLEKRIQSIVAQYTNIGLIIHAAGASLEKPITEHSGGEIVSCLNTAITTPALFVKYTLQKQEFLPGLIMITSTSAWTPRELEPIYAAAKAGEGHLAASLAQNKNIKKTLKAGPSGMNTPFWDNTNKDTSTMLDPMNVALIIYEYFQKEFTYKGIRILRNPERVEEEYKYIVIYIPGFTWFF